MSLIVNTLSPLRFADSPEAFLPEDYAFGQTHPLVVPMNTIPGFQLAGLGNYESQAIDTRTERFFLLRPGSSYRIDVTDEVISEMSRVKVLNGIRYARCPEVRLENVRLPEGRYYLYVVWEPDGEKYPLRSKAYSDTFCMTAGSDDLLCLEYGNSYDIALSGKNKGGVWFDGDFTFKCYLDTQIGKPEYYFEEEVKERLGYSFIESQVSKKIYKFTFLAPEYLCDAMRIVRLCDNKSITSRGKTYDLLTFSMNPQWQEQGDLASVECEFETDTVIANLGGYSGV